MALVYRRGRPYSYRSVRRNGKVTSEYRGSGEVALLIEAIDASERAERESEDTYNRHEREQIAADETAFLRYFDEIEAVARAALVASGLHEHKGTWRKRRGRPEPAPAERPSGC